jgi:uncharacterized protein YodC (DUF2158 family)
MLMLTKRTAIVAAILGAAPGATWVVPASVSTAYSKAEKKISNVTHLKTGDFVRARTGGPLMSVDSVENGQVTTSWWSEGGFRYGKFPIKMLMGPITIPPTHEKRPNTLANSAYEWPHTRQFRLQEN